MPVGTLPERGGKVTDRTCALCAKAGLTLHRPGKAVEVDNHKYVRARIYSFRQSDFVHFRICAGCARAITAAFAGGEDQKLPPPRPALKKEYA